MFRNRLTKVFRHLYKQARRQHVSCYRIYDHDLPEFPFCIELYGDHIYLAEYKRNHGMDDEAHESWLDECFEVIYEVLHEAGTKIYLRQDNAKPAARDNMKS